MIMVLLLVVYCGREFMFGSHVYTTGWMSLIQIRSLAYYMYIYSNNFSTGDEMELYMYMDKTHCVLIMQSPRPFNIPYKIVYK